MWLCSPSTSIIEDRDPSTHLNILTTRGRHKRGWTRAVAKPLISASAYRTIIHTTGVVHGELLIQEYMTSIEDEGECSLVYFAGRFSHALKKLP